MPAQSTQEFGKFTFIHPAHLFPRNAFEISFFYIYFYAPLNDKLLVCYVQYALTENTAKPVLFFQSHV